MMFLSGIYSLLSTSLLLCLDCARIPWDLCIVQAWGGGAGECVLVLSPKRSLIQAVALGVVGLTGGLVLTFRKSGEIDPAPLASCITSWKS
jgi:hypothetical protein